MPTLLLTLLAFLSGCSTSTTTGPSHPSGSMELKGTIREFPLPTRNSLPIGITSGPDGNLWFTEDSNGRGTGKIGRITPSGTIREFVLSAPDSMPTSITSGPDDNLWFTEFAPTAQSDKIVGQIGRITTAGMIREFALPRSNNQPGSITTGPDGALWFTEDSPITSKIGRLT